MSIADLFESGERKQQKGHFRNLVMLAHADGEVSSEENVLLQKIARGLDLTSEQVKDICENPKNYAINPPVSKEDRCERLVYLVEMMAADGVIDDNEVKLLHKYGIGLGFDDNQIIEVVGVTLTGLKNGKSESEIVEELVG